MTTTEIKTKNGDDLLFPDFDDISVSTKTFIAMTNINLNLKNLFEFLPITDYTVIPKKRGRKKKVGQTNPNKTLIEGSIITLKFENKIRGVDLKCKKNNLKKKSKWFRNSFTVVMIVDNKPINFKVCKNGMSQLTGCKSEYQAETCIKILWELIKHQKDIYTFTKPEDEEKLNVILIPAMRNIDFSLGFLVDREKLAKYMSTQTEFHSLLETSFGYTGVNIKIPLSHDISKMEIQKFINDDINTDKYTKKIITYGDYLEQLPEKEKKKRLTKERYNTFLVFHSGRVIVSGLTQSTTRDAYNYFLSIIRRCYNEIEERLDS